MAYGKGEDLNSMHCPQCQQELQAFGKFWICLEHGQVQVGELPQSGPEGTGGATQPKPKVFISYGRHDARDLADRLSGDLSAEGYEVWQDVREIRPGTLWEREIQDGLRSTQVVVAVLSPHAVRVAAGRAEAHDSDSVCLDELSYARFARPPTPIVPVMAIPCEPPFCIFRLDYVDLCDWKSSAEQYQAGFQRLLHGIEQTLRGETRYRSWEHQLQPWDFAAFLHAKRQHFCGREWLFDELNAWRVGRAEERALLITGDPGSGKSAIVAELVHRNPAGQVMAYHCCQANARETLKPARFVRSLAAMMASRLDAYAAQLETPSVRSALDPLHCEEDPGSSLDEGVLAPLERLPAPEDGARLILIDALDEALLHRGSPNIVEVLASRIERLPGWYASPLGHGRRRARRRGRLGSA